jgi:hypothetical protein
MLERWDGVMWTGLVWLRIGTGGELRGRELATTLHLLARYGKVELYLQSPILLHSIVLN